MQVRDIEELIAQEPGAEHALDISGRIASPELPVDVLDPGGKAGLADMAWFDRFCDDEIERLVAILAQVAVAGVPGESVFVVDSLLQDMEQATNYSREFGDVCAAAGLEARANMRDENEHVEMDPGCRVRVYLYASRRQEEDGASGK